MVTNLKSVFGKADFNAMLSVVLTIVLFFLGSSDQDDDIEQFITIEDPSPDTALPAEVLLVPGSGFNTRDYPFSASFDTEQSNLFVELSDILAKSGYRVIRYDEPSEIITDQTYSQLKSSRLAAVLKFIRGQKSRGGNCLIVLTISEGIFTLVDAAATVGPPSAVLGISAPLQSKSDVIRWQLTQRLPHILLSLDSDHDRRISEEELLSGWESTSLGESPPPTFLIEDGHVNLRAVERAVERLETMFDRNKTTPEQLSSFQTDPQLATILEDWILDHDDPVEELNSMGMPIALIYGQNDGQLPIDDQIFQSRRLANRVGPPEVIPGVGHALGQHQLYGPMLPISYSTIANMMRRLESSVPACASN